MKKIPGGALRPANARCYMIFDDLKEIKELYEEGEIPDPEELSGEFYVTAQAR